MFQSLYFRLSSIISYHLILNHKELIHAFWHFRTRDILVMSNNLLATFYLLWDSLVHELWFQSLILIKIWGCVVSKVKCNIQIRHSRDRNKWIFDLIILNSLHKYIYYDQFWYANLAFLGLKYIFFIWMLRKK